MGFSIYLTGETYISKRSDIEQPTEDGYEITGHLFRFGYLLGSSYLHQYIVDNFGNGFDDQHMHLDMNELKQIKQAIQGNQLQDEFDEDDIETLNKAIEWLKKDQTGVCKDVIYKACW